MIVVRNTSPLILLAKIYRLDLLPRLYDKTIVPALVLDEVAAKSGKEVKQIQALVKEQKCQVRQTTRRALPGFPADLGGGEREAIALALETGADLVILDDQLGRRVGREKGLRVTGTVGVLVEARARGLISSLREELDRLIEAGRLFPIPKTIPKQTQ